MRCSHGKPPSQLFVFPAAGAVVLAIVGKGYRLALAATVGLMVKETQLTGERCGWHCAVIGLMAGLRLSLYAQCDRCDLGAL